MWFFLRLAKYLNACAPGIVRRSVNRSGLCPPKFLNVSGHLFEYRINTPWLLHMKSPVPCILFFPGHKTAIFTFQKIIIAYEIYYQIRKNGMCCSTCRSKKQTHSNPSIHFKHIQRYENKIENSREDFVKLIKLEENLSRILEKVYLYPYMLKDLDSSNNSTYLNKIG